MVGNTVKENDSLYVAVEGMIGAGKTTLTRLLGERLEARVVLDHVDENPFLKDFYQNPRQYAFLTQINFLFLRYEQQINLLQQDLFHRVVITDYLFIRDKIFASINLDEREFALYERISSLLVNELPAPDLVIYLQASTDFLMENIRRRTVSNESSITKEYLMILNEAFNQFFFRYTDSPLLVLNANLVDYLRDPGNLEDLAKYIREPYSGTRFYNPLG